jgi:hypothetical protein
MSFISQLPIYQDQNDNPNINSQGGKLPQPTPDNPNPYDGKINGYLSANTMNLSPQVQQGNLPVPYGVDKSWVEGYLASKQLGFETDANKRANSTQSIAEEKFSWDRYDKQRQMAIQSGMSLAARDGGFNGVIDYLQGAAPDLALEMQKSKSELDTAMMENETYKLAHSNDKNQVLIEGYKLLGGIGATLLKTPSDQREDTYQALLPVAKQIDPSLPNTLNEEAVSKMALGMSLSTPAAILYDANKNATIAQSASGKLQADIEARVKKGETVENSPSLKNLLNQADAANYQAIKLKNEAEQTKYSQENQNLATAKNKIEYNNMQQQLLTSITRNYENRSRSYADFQTSNTKVDAALQSLKVDPTNPTAQQTLQFAFAKALSGPGVMSDQDINRTASNSGEMAQALKYIQSLGTGDKVVLTPREIDNISKMTGIIRNVYEKRQNETNLFYRTQLQNNSLPENSIQYYKSAPPEAVKYLYDNNTPKNREYFKSTFGYEPDTSSMGN